MDFNSRARKGATSFAFAFSGLKGISTHAPVRARLPPREGEDGAEGISTHAPVRARHDVPRDTLAIPEFQLTRP